MVSLPPDTWFVAIGASGSDGLGNIKALLHGLGLLPNGVVMVVLHRSFDHPSNLRDVLRTATGMQVVIAEQGERLDRGVVYIGEPDGHLTLLERARGAITKDRDRWHRGRTVDLLFESLAAHARDHAIGVVLSGSLDDGSRGVAAIHKAGGTTMVLLRHPEYPGMPENAIAYDGPIDLVGSTAEIAARITAMISGEPAHGALEVPLVP